MKPSHAPNSTIIDHRFAENGQLEFAFEENPHEYISEALLENHQVQIDTYINSIAEKLALQNLKNVEVQTQSNQEIFKEISDFSDDHHIPTKINEINSDFGTTNVSLDGKNHTEDISTKYLLTTNPNLYNDYFLSLKE